MARTPGLPNTPNNPYYSSRWHVPLAKWDQCKAWFFQETAFNPEMPGLADPIIAQLFGDGQSGALFDPSDLSTLWQNTAGTTPVTAAGQLVRRMDDLSGNGHHMIFTLSGTGNGFRYQTDGSRHWIENPTTTNDFGYGFFPLVGNGTNWTIIIGQRALTADANRYLFDSNTPRQYVQLPHDPIFTGSDINTASILNLDRVLNFTREAAARRARVNGVQTFTSASGGTGLGTTGTGGNGQFFCRRYTDQDRGSIRFYGGVWRQDGFLTGDDLAAAEAWVAERSGVTLP